MKKFLAVLLSLVMAVSISIPAFAADVSLPSVSTDIITSQIESLLGSNINQQTIATLIKIVTSTDKIDVGTIVTILNKIAKAGSSTGSGTGTGTSSNTAIRDQLDSLDAAGRTKISDIIEEFLTTDYDANPYLDANNNKAYNPAKVTALINAMSRMEYSEIQSVLDDLHSSKAKDGTAINAAMTDGAYNVLTAEVVRQEDVSKQAAATATTSSESTTSALDGVKGFLSGAFNTISGLFGGGSPDTTTTTKKSSTTAKSGSSSSSSSIPKTGDVALFSVAGVALAAGIALVLTKKKKDDK